MEAKSGYGLSLDEELKILRVIRQLNETTPIEFVPTFLARTRSQKSFAAHRSNMWRSSFTRCCRPSLRNNSPKAAISFASAATSTSRNRKKFLMAAQEHGLRIRMHVDQLTNSGGAFLAARLHAATADHLEQTNAAEIAALAEAGVQPVLLPASVYALGKTRYPKARTMIEAGLAVVLATDFNPGSSPTPSIRWFSRSRRRR
jgi:imidazolonepropionase